MRRRSARFSLASGAADAGAGITRDGSARWDTLRGGQELEAENSRRRLEMMSRMDQVYRTLRAIVTKLKEADIPYAIVGSLALAEYGYERATTDVDLLLTREGLDKLRARILGRGYVEQFRGSKGLRDTRSNVKVDVLIAGGFPGDGKPKAIAFPDPALVAVPGKLGSVVPLTTLIEMKLASGMSSGDRLKDLADVQELIRAARLPLALARKLHPSVRETYSQLWRDTSRDEG